MVEGSHEKQIGIHGTGTEITEVVTYLSSAWEEDSMKKPEISFPRKMLVSQVQNFFNPNRTLIWLAHG